MFQDLNVFRAAQMLAIHAGRRQAVIATNVAHADSPGYRARDLAAFSLTPAADRLTGLNATRTRHLHGQDAGADHARIEQTDTPVDISGNSVSIEQEMLNAVDARRQHDRALAVYRSSLSILRSSLRTT